MIVTLELEGIAAIRLFKRHFLLPHKCVRSRKFHLTRTHILLRLLVLMWLTKWVNISFDHFTRAQTSKATTTKKCVQSIDPFSVLSPIDCAETVENDSSIERRGYRKPEREKINIVSHINHFHCLWTWSKHKQWIRSFWAAENFCQSWTTKWRKRNVLK